MYRDEVKSYATIVLTFSYDTDVPRWKLRRVSIQSINLVYQNRNFLSRNKTLVSSSYLRNEDIG